MKSIKAAVIGATGYAGEELVRLLYNHPEVDVKVITSKSYLGENYTDIYSNFNHITEDVLQDDDLEKISKEVDVIFVALPHGILTKKITKEILDNCKIIDLGADFRIEDKDVYEKWYATDHLSFELMDKVVYGLCEVHRDKIKNAKLVANPGCYTTTSILSLYPVVAESLIDTNTITIDAKSGVTGAGRGVSLNTHYCETNENMKAYKVASHRHTPEIEQELSKAANEDIKLTFTPHLTPMNRGILATCYANLKAGVTYEDVKQAYEKHFKNEYFVRLMKKGNFPETKWVKGSNFIDIGFEIDERCNKLIVLGALDNLVKGAAGQAVQNMNILFGLDERCGLNTAGIFPV